MDWLLIPLASKNKEMQHQQKVVDREFETISSFNVLLFDFIPRKSSLQILFTMLHFLNLSFLKHNQNKNI